MGRETAPQRTIRGVALGGFMGVGKTAVGIRLAERLSVPFLDTDAVLAVRFGPVAEQIGGEGEATFRLREAALVRELDDGAARVVATGGGLWVDPENRRLLRRHHHLVVLTASLRELEARVGSGEGRPLWGPDAAVRLAARKEAYADADAIVDTTGLRVEDVVEKVLQCLPK